jgi:hypothetical protein
MPIPAIISPRRPIGGLVLAGTSSSNALFDNWKWASPRRRNSLLILLSGIPFYTYFGWVYNLTLEVPFAPLTTTFDLNEAQYHVAIGTIGLAVAAIFLARNLIDRGLKRIGFPSTLRRQNR